MGLRWRLRVVYSWTLPSPLVRPFKAMFGLKFGCVAWPVNRGHRWPIFLFSYPDLPIHYTTFMGLQWWLKVVYRWTLPLLRPIWCKILCLVENCPKICFFKKMGLKCKVLFLGPTKGTFLCETMSFDVLFMKIGAGCLAVRHRQNHQKNYHRWVTLYVLVHVLAGRTRGGKTPYWIVMKFFTGVGVPDIITHVNFCSGFLGTAGGGVSTLFHLFPFVTVGNRLQVILIYPRKTQWWTTNIFY